MFSYLFRKFKSVYRSVELTESRESSEPEVSTVSLEKVRAYLHQYPIIEFKGQKSGTPLVVKTDNKARFVRFSLQTEVSFHLDTIEIFDKNGCNIEADKKTIISSCYNDEEKYDGKGALLGRKNGGCGFHTKREANPWLIVDLGSITNLGKIIVYNREGEFYTRALSLMIQSSSDLKRWDLIYDNWACKKQIDVNSYSEEERALIFAGALDAAPAQALIKNYLASGQSERASILHQQVNKLVEEKGLSLAPQHGFTQPFNLTSEEQKNRTYKELAILLKWINQEFSLPAFISSGTLLGIVRDGQFIGHDDDVDICYVSGKSDKQEILSEREALIAFLQSKGCKLAPSGLAHYWCTTPGGTNLDIFTGFLEEGFCSMNPIGRRLIQQDDVLPLKTVVIKGVELYLPRNPDPLLALNYGPNWRIPDPLWTFDWGRAKKDFEFLYT